MPHDFKKLVNLMLQQNIECDEEGQASVREYYVHVWF